MKDHYLEQSRSMAIVRIKSLCNSSLDSSLGPTRSFSTSERNLANPNPNLNLNPDLSLKFNLGSKPKSNSSSFRYLPPWKQNKKNLLKHSDEQLFKEKNNSAIKLNPPEGPKKNTDKKKDMVAKQIPKRRATKKVVLPSMVNMFKSIEDSIHLNESDDILIQKTKLLVSHRLKSTDSKGHLTALTILKNKPILIEEYLKHYFYLKSTDDVTDLKTKDSRISFSLSSDYLNAILSSIMNLFSEYPDQSIDGIRNFFVYLKDKKLTIPASKASDLFSNCIYFARDKADSLRLLKTLKEGFSDGIVLESCDLKLQDYFTKWSYLATLDILENILEENRHREIAQNCTFKLLDAQKNRYSFLPLNSLKLRGTTLIRIQDQKNKCYFGISEHSDFQTEEKTVTLFLPFHNPIDTNQTFTIFEVTTMAPYNAQMKALIKVTKRGKTIPCPHMFSLIVGNENSSLQTDNSSTKTLNLFKTLNESQNAAIQNVVGQPISLIQGPPGTGKTHTLAHLVYYLAKIKQKKVLVVAPTNAGADNALDFCLRHGLNPIRIGDFEATRPDMQKYMIQNMVPDYFANFSQSLNLLKNHADVIVTTCASSASPLLEKIQIDYLIIDEASQLTEPIALIPVTLGPKSIILVGDHQQLPPTVGYLSSLEGYADSLFARMATLLQPNLLDTQYRSHPLIMSISSKLFYNDSLKHGVESQNRTPPPGFPWPKTSCGKSLPVAFVPTYSMETSGNTLSKRNEKEAKVVLEIVESFISHGMDPDDIGVISPYAGQNSYIGKLLSQKKIPIRPASVDSFQGREKEVIVFSATRANFQSNLGFLADHRRFNVMHTRAKRGLIVVGNRKTLGTGGNANNDCWKSWLEWIDENGLLVTRR